MTQSPSLPFRPSRAAGAPSHFVVEQGEDRGAVIDPALVQELVRTRKDCHRLDTLSAREREVLALMAEGRSNGGSARQIWVADATVEKHVHSILG